MCRIRHFHPSISTKTIFVSDTTTPRFNTRASFCPIHFIPFLRRFRLEPLQALAHWRCINHAIPIRATNIISITMVLWQGLVHTSSPSLRNPCKALANIKGLVYNNYRNHRTILESVSHIHFIFINHIFVIIKWIRLHYRNSTSQNPIPRATPIC